MVSVFGSINAIHVTMDSNEKTRLSQDDRVDFIEEDILLHASSTQENPGWALDRIDEPGTTYVDDGTYEYTNDGSGRTIYILDSGLNLDIQAVADEFGGRASVFWDVNGKGGKDCTGHGSMVSSAAAGSTYGVAKGATLIMAKITDGCTGDSYVSTSVLAFNWLAENAPAGTIVNWSHGFYDKFCKNPWHSLSLENAIKKAHDAGIIVVVSAGNEGCNTIPQKICQRLL